MEKFLTLTLRLLLQGLEFTPDLVLLVLHGIGGGLEENGGFHVFNRIGEAHGLHIVGIGGFEGLDVGVAIARCLDQVFALPVLSKVKPQNQVK